MPVVPLRYTGVRKEEYDDIVKPLRNQGILVDSLIRRLNRNEKNARARAEKTAQKEREEAKKLLEAVRKTEQRIKEERKEPKKKSFLNTITKAINDSKPIEIKKTQMKNAGVSLNDILNILATSPKNVLITFGDTVYTVNDNTRPRIQDIIKNGALYQYQVDSDGALAQVIRNFPSFSVSFPTIKRRALGAFFKYTHSTSLDLSRYGVFSTVVPDNYNDTCLIVALQNSNIAKEKIESIKHMVKNRVIPKTDLEKICKQLQVSIILKTEDSSKGSRNVFGKEYVEKVNIGLLDDHYFLIEEVPITSFALRNYSELKDIPNFQSIIKQKGKYYERDEKRFISSFELIKILLEKKDELLYPITLENQMIASTQFYDRVVSEITNLEYDPATCITPVQKKPEKEDKNNYVNMFFDFETCTENEHVPYLCCLYDGHITKTFYGSDCGIKMLSSLRQNTRIIAHNAGYDYRFIVKYLRQINEISKGTHLISASGVFGSKNIRVEIKDSYNLITMPLIDFTETFNLGNVKKQIMPYSLYTQNNIKNGFVSIAEALTHVSEADKEQFISNIDKWNLRCDNNSYDILQYSARYCEIDCEVLAKGYNTFRGWIQKAFNLDTNTILTAASLAHTFFVNSDCYEGVNALSGVPQLFIQKCVVGGRVMCSENKKNYIPSYVGNDFDATSLYPSAMARLPGFLKGSPKVITNLSYDWLKQQDNYFVEIVVKSVGIPRKFPLMSYVNKKGVRTFTNDMIGKTMFVDKTTLEDLMEFQKITFSVVRGYYFDEGFNSKINDTIRYVFNERVKAKKEKNDIQMVYKLIMNSGYGKSIMKPVESEFKFFDIYKGEEELQTFISRNYNWIKSYTYFGSSVKVEMVKRLSTHSNIAQVGVSILSMSKRIMNEVMCCAEDNGIDIYYQDTDSMHLKDADIPKLGEAFQTKYDRILIGDALGQFHSDFELNDCKNIVCTRSIFLGKKCYIDELQGTNKNGEKETGYHIRMKGIPEKVIEYTYKKQGYKNPFDMYEALYKGKEIIFDLTNDGTKANFKFNKNYTINTVIDFKRKIKF